MRVLPLVEGGGKIIVVGGMVHRSLIVEQLEAVGATAQILLEPEGRDSAPAMAAAAAWTLAHDPDGVNVFVSSDHYVPQKAAFIDAVKKAVVGAEQKRIVTLGIRPTEPSTAYGYIAPSGPGLSDVERFVEKPDLEAAKGFLASGYLWNAGIFICRADVLHREFEACESTVWQVAAASLAGVGGQSIAVLGRDFRKAPKISIDYAVMENTECASVLEVDFHWTDLGAWDAIAARGDGEYGAHIFEDAEGCMVRAPEGTLVAALGVRDLGIIVENDAVLVCDLSRSQEVKKIVERVKVLSPQHLDFHVQKPADIKESGKTFFNWMRLRALPVWHSLGQEEDGVFAEALTLTGGDVSLTHRLRVQTRQLYCFAEAGRMGWGGRWRSTVEAGLAALDRYFLYEDGLVVSAIHPDRTPVGREALIYDQAFALFAWAAVFRHGIQAERVRDRAVALLERLKRNWLPQGGIKEFGGHPYQSNAHMHLLEACISWAEIDSDPRWMQMADSIVELAMNKFIDAERGCLREFFDENWNPQPGDSGRIVEPGHQFEWLWLLLRYGKLRNDTSILVSVKPLYAWGQKGFWDTASVMLDSLNDDGTARVRRARLWPQTEWLKAALLMAEQSGEADRKAYLEDAAAALRSLKLYLTPEGLWHDKRVSNQSFIDEPSPATSFYHIMGACSQLAQTNENLRLDIRSAGFSKILH